MKISNNDVAAKFAGVIEINEKVLGYFHAWNKESQSELITDVFVKKDQFFFALTESGMYIGVERDRRASETKYFVKSGYYLWESIKLLKLEKKNKEPSLTIQLADGSALIAAVDLIDEKTRELLFSKEREPAPDDVEFNQNKEKANKEKRINTILGLIGIVIFIIICSFRGC
jgi:hypothetical protein